MSASVWGSISIRPVLVGLTVDAADLSKEGLEECVELATSSWGGAFYPILAPEDTSEAIRLAEFFDVDVLEPVADAVNGSEALKSLGLTWGPFSSPFDRSPGSIGSNVLGVAEVFDAFFAEESDYQPLLVTWEQDHPLSLLNLVLFGKYGVDEEAAELQRKFSLLSKRIHLRAEDPLPGLAAGNPITATRHGAHIGHRAAAGVVVVDASNPADVVAFWNHRSLGHNVVPWPVGHEKLVTSMVSLWLEANRGRWPSGFQGQPEIDVWTAGKVVPEKLKTQLDDALGQDVTILVSDLTDYATSLTADDRRILPVHSGRVFDVKIDDDASSFQIPPPQLDFLQRRLWSDQFGTVAAEVETRMEHGLRPGWKASAPGVREFSGALRKHSIAITPFIRPIRKGLVLGYEAADDLVQIPLIRSVRLLDTLLEPDQWVVSQSDSGRYVARFIDMLGGAYQDSAANQEAVRSVLEKAMASPYGQPEAALVEAARASSKDWHRSVADVDYPKDVVRWLTSLSVLRAKIKLLCPSCGTYASLSADELRDQMVCELCGDSSPLGVVLTMRKPSWLLGTAPVLDKDRLRETYPVMATLSTFAAMEVGGELPHHIVGATFEKGAFSCEADLVMFLHTHDRPLAVICEAKSYRDELDEEDVFKLVTVQDAIRARGLDCQILFATMRERLSDNEKRLLRTLSERSPAALRARRGVAQSPLLPVVLTRNSLSARTYSDSHPAALARGGSVEGLAIKTAERELGFEGFILADPPAWPPGRLTIRWEALVDPGTDPGPSGRES